MLPRGGEKRGCEGIGQRSGRGGGAGAGEQVALPLDIAGIGPAKRPARGVHRGRGCARCRGSVARQGYDNFMLCEENFLDSGSDYLHK